MNNRFLTIGALGLMLVLGSQFKVMAIDSTSSIDEITFLKSTNENVPNEQVEVSKDKMETSASHLTRRSSQTDFPEVSLNEITVHEETIETVKISDNVINWISATENILGIRYDKGIQNFVADYDGKNCYLRYSGKRILVYIITENAVYPTWLVPDTIPAVHIKLKKNNPLGGKSSNGSGMAGQKVQTYSNNKETQLIEMLKYAYADHSGPIAVSKLQKVNVIDGVRGYRFKSIKFEDGMYVQIYLFKLGVPSVDKALPITEKDFLLPELCYYPIAVAIEHPELRKDRFTRVFIVGAEKPKVREDYEL